MVNLIFSPKSVDLSLSLNDGIIKAKDVAALEDAHSVLKAAQNKAAEIMEAARHEHEQEKQRGYAEGRAQAEQEAFARLLAEQAFLDRKLQETERALAGLVQTAVRNILSDFSNQELAQSVTRSALQRMRREKHVQIRIAPEMAADFHPFADKLNAAYPEIQSIEIIEDHDLQPPDLIVESSTSRLECSLGDKLEELDRLIMSTLAPADNSAPPAHEEATP